MYRALFAICLLVTSEARSASDAYEMDFPPPAATPIVTATCEGLDLPCRLDWTTFVTPAFHPFRWAQSIFRSPAAPAHKGNMFAFVEIPYIDHGEDDYDRLQDMIGQTGAIAERLWVRGRLGFDGADFGTQYRIVRAVIPSKKATDAVGLCVFPVLNEKTAAPDICSLLAFRSENRRFLLSSVGFEVGDERANLGRRYTPKTQAADTLSDRDPKDEILKSRRTLEQSFGTSIKSSLEEIGIFEHQIAIKRSDNFAEAPGNESELSYIVLKKWNSETAVRQSFQQTLQLRFEFEVGSRWWAEMHDGSEQSGIELFGGKQDWAIGMRWEVRTAVADTTRNNAISSVFTFREPQAVGVDTVKQMQKEFLSLMNKVCAPQPAIQTAENISTLTGYISIGCEAD